MSTIDGGAVREPRRSVAAACRRSPDFPREAGFTSNKRTYSYGAHAAHVAVDPKTGAIELIDYVAVEDVGRIINPLTLHGQAVGAIVQGLGGALLEHFVYDEDGQLLTGSFADYLLPTASDFPSIRVIALEEKPSPTQSARRQGRRRRRHHSGRRRRSPTRSPRRSPRSASQPSELPLSPPRVWELINQQRDP